jgi:hypothetical protein
MAENKEESLDIKVKTLFLDAATELNSGYDRRDIPSLLMQFITCNICHTVACFLQTINTNFIGMIHEEENQCVHCHKKKFENDFCTYRNHVTYCVNEKARNLVAKVNLISIAKLQRNVPLNHYYKLDLSTHKNEVEQFYPTIKTTIKNFELITTFNFEKGRMTTILSKSDKVVKTYYHAWLKPYSEVLTFHNHQVDRLSVFDNKARLKNAVNSYQKLASDKIQCNTNKFGISSKNVTYEDSCDSWCNTWNTLGYR